MAIPQMEDDVEVISKLGDTPGSDDGLTAQQLKGRFDLAGVRIKNFINNTLIPHLNQLVDVQALLDGILDTSLTKEDKAAPAKTVGDALSKKLNVDGGELTGDLNLNQYRITGLGYPVQLEDAVTKGYCDAKKILFSVALPQADWSEEAPFVQTVAAAGMLETDHPHWDVLLSSEVDTAIMQRDAFAAVDDLDTTKDSVMFTCFERKPEVDLTILMEVHR